jgi:hypothetical protein
MAWAGQSSLATISPRVELSPRAQILLGGRAALWVAWLCWGTLIVTVSVLILFGSDRTVVPTYRDAALQWFSGRDIYLSNGHGFLYLPSAAILFAPFAQLPNAASEIVWRVLTIGSFAVGVRRLSTLAGRGLGMDLFPLMTLAAFPPAMSCARNGQSTLVMTALMMLAVVELAGPEAGGGRRWRATLWLSLSLAFKPLAVAMILLVAALDRRMAWRLVVGVGLVLLFPFLTETPHYVATQYVNSLQMFRVSSLFGMTVLWAQPLSALTLIGVRVPESVQTLIRAVAALATLVLCWQAQRRHGLVRAVEYLFSFSVLYILLFNPRTENNTYAMLGPAIGLFAVPWIGNFRHRAALAFLSLLLIGLAAGDELVRALAPPGEHIWLKPSLAILFLMYLIGHVFAPQDDRRVSSRFDGEPRPEISVRPVLNAVGTAPRGEPILP